LCLLLDTGCLLLGDRCLVLCFVQDMPTKRRYIKLLRFFVNTKESNSSILKTFIILSPFACACKKNTKRIMDIKYATNCRGDYWHEKDKERFAWPSCVNKDCIHVPQEGTRRCQCCAPISSKPKDPCSGRSSYNIISAPNTDKKTARLHL
jgi:hypothetical protein